MSTYKKEFGTGVQNAAGTLSGVIEGQLWYDSTAASFKYQYPAVTTSGAWATGGSLNTARPQITAFGTQTAGLFFGGGAEQLWYQFVGLEGAETGLDHYGASGKPDLLYKEFGITVQDIVKKAKELKK